MNGEEHIIPRDLGAEPPRPVHSYTLLAPNQISIFKRTDLREVVQIGVVMLLDGAISIKAIGDEFCAAFDHELMTRGAAAQTGESGNGGT